MKASALFLTIALCMSSCPAMVLAADQKTVQTVEQIKADKIKSLARRDPKFSELLIKAETSLAKLEKEEPKSSIVPRLKSELTDITMNSGGYAENKFRANLELLEALTIEHQIPKTEDLVPLQERYKKISEQLDDLVLNKDLSRALHIHDKLIRYTALGLWDPNKIATELSRIETLISNAPDIPYGRSEILNGYKNRKLTAVAGLHYLGTFPHEEEYLTSDRPSVGLLEDRTGFPTNLETRNHLIQDSAGNLIEISQANNPLLQIPFSPPLSLWAKSRILEGRIPSISLCLVENTQSSSTQNIYYCLQDILDGKLDSYFTRVIQDLNEAKIPLLLGILCRFDQGAAANSFGQDGKTPFYFLLDPKLKSLSELKLQEELKKRIEKGSFSSAKALIPELCNQYGDDKIPDGPERVQAVWKRIKGLINNCSADTISLYSNVGPFHGNKAAAKYSGQESVGNQSWNNLDYYYPGDDVLEWIGIDTVGSAIQTDTKDGNIMQCLEAFMAEARSSRWQTTPVMLRGLSPSVNINPNLESDWLISLFQKIIPDTFPNINIIFLSAPNQVTLWSTDALSSYRTAVANNKIYKWPLRFKTVGTH